MVCLHFDGVDLLADLMEVRPGQQSFGLRRRLEQHERAIFDAISSVLLWIVRHGPTVVVLEDLHWADPTSLRLTKELLALTNEAPLLMVLTRRPGRNDGATVLETALIANPELNVWKLELSHHRQPQGVGPPQTLDGETADQVTEAV